LPTRRPPWDNQKYRDSGRGKMPPANDEQTAVDGPGSPEQTEEHEPIDLAMLVDDDYLDRFGSTFAHMVIGLVSEVVRITVVCPNPDRLGDLPTGPAKTIQFRPSPWPWRNRPAVERLAGELAAAKIGLIHSCCGTQSNLARELAGRMDRPYVVSVTGLLQEECYWHVDHERCRALIAISEPIRQALRECYPPLAQRIHLVRPGYFCRERSPVKPADRAKTIVTAGAFTRRSGHDVLLRALAELAETDINFLAFLIGTGPLETMLHRWARKAGIGSRITFLAPIRDWQQTLDDADVYVQPGPISTLHSGPYEAVARGCPVIATPETAFDLVLDGQTGSLFPRGDTKALVDVLARLLGRSDVLDTLSQSTVSFAKEHLSLYQACSALAEIYRTALNHDRTENVPRS